MRKMLIVIAALSVAATPALAAPCRNAKGKFVKCPTAAAQAADKVVKDAKGKCHIAAGPKKGQFTKCP